MSVVHLPGGRGGGREGKGGERRVSALLSVQKTIFLLGSHSVLKFGVGISNDARRLAAGFGVQMSGCVDLQHIALRCGVRWVISYSALLVYHFFSRRNTSCAMHISG